MSLFAKDKFLGKRKRGDPTDPSDPPFISLPAPLSDAPCSSRMNIVTFEPNPSQPIDINFARPTSSVTGIMDGSAKQHNSQLSLGHHHHHHNLGRSVFLKRSRHHYGHQYSRRNPSGHNIPSASHHKSVPFLDESVCFKAGGRYNPEFGHHRGKHYSDKREKGSFKQERIRCYSSVINTTSSSSEGLQMVCCGICQKSLGWWMVVAVLVCGHVYHTECLEHCTQRDNIQDPSCPLCSTLLSKAEAA